MKKQPWDHSQVEVAEDLGLYRGAARLWNGRAIRDEIERRYGLVPGGYLPEVAERLLSRMAAGAPYAEAFTAAMCGR